MTYEEFCEVAQIDDGVLIEWITGGLPGNDALPPTSKTPLEEILERVCPSITYLTYRDLFSTLVEHDVSVQYGYYGDVATCSIYVVHPISLYRYLSSKGLLNG